MPAAPIGTIQCISLPRKILIYPFLWLGGALYWLPEHRLSREDVCEPDSNPQEELWALSKRSLHVPFSV